MPFLYRFVIIIAKGISFFSARLGLGAGETWPGEIALRFKPDILTRVSEELSEGVVLVAGTNGKTTTSLLITTILEHAGRVVIHNATGANLVNGIVSSLVRNADWLGRFTADTGVFEVDENSLPQVLSFMAPSRIVILNLFRDQLDRYGEVDVITEKWQKALSGLPVSTQVIANSDDPGVVWVTKSAPGTVTYFGVNDKAAFLKKREHATDSMFCAACGSRLTYDGIYYSHIGLWRCPSCSNTRPQPEVTGKPKVLTGLYNRYNALAAIATCRTMGISLGTVHKALASFTPAFGRQEELGKNGRKVKLFLSKNPAGYNASLRTVLEQKATYFLFVLNDRIPDGRDVSWIWDVDFETIPASAVCYVSGDRVYDMALRLKYAGVDTRRITAGQDLASVLHQALTAVPSGETLYVLPTYSAMLEVRKLLTGRKIL